MTGTEEREITINEICDKLQRFSEWWHSYNNESHEGFSNGWVKGRLDVAIHLLMESSGEWQSEFVKWQKNGEPVEVDY